MSQKHSETKILLKEKIEELNLLLSDLVIAYAIFNPIYSKDQVIIDFKCMEVCLLKPSYSDYYSPERIVGKSLLEIDPSAIEKGFLSKCIAVIEKSKIEVFESQYSFSEMNALDLEIAAYPIHKHLILVFKDNTEQRKAKRELAKTEIKYKTLINSILDYVYSVEFENGQVAAQFHSKECLRITGYAHQEYLNDPNLWFNMVHPDDKQMVLHYVELRSKEKVVMPIEHRIIDKNGKSKWISNHANLTFNDKSELIRIDGIIQDITDRKISEGLIKESEEKYRILFEASPGSIIVVRSSDNTVFAVNKKLHELLGYCEEEIIGKSIHDLNFWEEETKRNLFLNDLNHFGEIQNYRARILNKNHDKLDCLLSARVIVYGNEPARMVIIQDITKIIRTEEQLLLLNEAIEQSIEIIIITDVSGNIQYVNSSFERITGYSKEFAIGKNPRFLKSGKHNSEFYKSLWSTIIKGNVWSGEIVNKKKHDEYYTEEMSITPIKNEHGIISHFVAVVRDITEFRKISEEKNKLETQLFQAQKMESVGRLASGIAHDVNNMLGIILTSAEIIKSSNPIEPNLTHISNIEKTCKQTANLVKQLLLFSKQTQLNPVILDVGKLLRETVKILYHSLGKDIEISIDLNDIPSYIEADEIQIQQIIINLSVNARDAMPSGGQLKFILRNVYLDEEFCKSRATINPGTFAEIIVEDIGIGIDSENIIKIFDPFYTTKETGKGTGLGLSVVYGIVSSHNGLIEVFSEPDYGTRFHVYLPLTKHQTVLIEQEAQDTIYKGHGTVLVIDDEELILNSVKEILILLGYKVLTINNGLESINLYKEFEIDVIVLDLIMPKFDGYATFKELCRIDPKVKVIFCTGAADQLKTSELKIENENYLIKKPFSISELSRKIRNVLKSEL